eukprot:Nk52_evm12s2473 gene=Nk52_evmTU12s2473
MTGMSTFSIVLHPAFHISCAVLGAGTLGLPYTLMECGWYGLPMFALLSALMCYTGVLLGNLTVKLRSAGISTYPALGEYCWGRVGRYVVLVCQITTCAGTAIAFLVLCGENMKMLTNLYSQTFWTCMAAVVVYPTIFFRSLKEALFVSIFGFLSAFGGALLISGEAVMEANNDAVHNTQIGPSNIFRAFGVFLFSYGSHPIFIAIQRTSPKPEYFKYSVMAAFGFIYCVYNVVMVCGYYAFGDAVEGNILSNLPQNTGFYIVTSAMTAHVLLAYIVFMNPVFQLLEMGIGVPHKAMACPPSTESAGQHSEATTITDIESAANTEVVKTVDGTATESEKARHEMVAVRNVSGSLPEVEILPVDVEWNAIHRVKSIALRSAVVGFTLFIALLIPFFNDIMSFIGGSTIAMACVILPICFHLVVHWKTASTLSIVFHIVIAAIGVAGGLSTCYFAIEEIISKASTYTLF